MASSLWARLAICACGEVRELRQPRRSRRPYRCPRCRARGRQGRELAALGRLLAHGQDQAGPRNTSGDYPGRQ
jgi:hypothetical protein